MSDRNRALAALCAAFLSATASQAGEPAAGAQPPRVLRAKHVDTLAVDGRLSDAAWSNAPEYALELYDAYYDQLHPASRQAQGTHLHEGGSVKLLWDANFLYVGVKQQDSDVVAEGQEDQLHHYTMGDVVEVFLKPADDTYYWEIYATPANRKTCFFFPGRGRLFLPSVADYKPAAPVAVSAAVEGTLNNWRDRDGGWSVVLAIPAKELTAYGARFDASARWTILVARYNYSRYLATKEGSSAPRLSAFNNHLYEEYAELRLEP